MLAASLVLLALVGGVIGTSFGLLRAQEARRAEAKRAEGERQAKETAQRRLLQIEKANEILGSIFNDLNPEAAKKEGKPLQALLGERLDQATAQLEGEAIGDPVAVARMQITLGESQGALGYSEKAIRLLSNARTTLTALLGPDDDDTLESINDLAWAYRAAGKLNLALPLFEETLERRKAKLGPDDVRTLTSMNNLALSYQDADKLDLALPLYAETLTRRKATLGPDHEDTLQSMNNLAWGYQAAGKDDLALPLFEDILEPIKANFGPEHPNTLKTMSSLGRGYIRTGQAAKAEPLLRGCMAIREKKEPDAWATFDTKSMLGAALLGQKKYSEAEPLLLAGYQGMKQRAATMAPPNKIRLIEALERLLRLYKATGKQDEVKEWQQKLAEAKTPSKPVTHP